MERRGHSDAYKRRWRVGSAGADTAGPAHVRVRRERFNMDRRSRRATRAGEMVRRPAVSSHCGDGSMKTLLMLLALSGSALSAQSPATADSVAVRRLLDSARALGLPSDPLVGLV